MERVHYPAQYLPWRERLERNLKPLSTMPRALVALEVSIEKRGVPPQPGDPSIKLVPFKQCETNACKIPLCRR